MELPQPRCRKAPRLTSSPGSGKAGNASSPHRGTLPYHWRWIHKDRSEKQRVAPPSPPSLDSSSYFDGSPMVRSSMVFRDWISRAPLKVSVGTTMTISPTKGGRSPALAAFTSFQS